MSPTSIQNWPVHILHGAVEPDVIAHIDDLAAAAREQDGNPPLSEQTLIDLRSGDADAPSLLTLTVFAVQDHADPATGTDLAGVAVVVGSGPEAVLELVVHPNYRDQGVGALLASKLLDVRGSEGVHAWSHGNHEAAAELATQFGYVPVRELWRMRLSRPKNTADRAPVTPVPLPDGVRIRTFVPGTDEAAWLKANGAAFAHHPEQGSMRLSDLHARMAEDWFDPQGFLLAVRGDGSSEELLGFHWTKVHAASEGHPAVGEVYVVGVTPQAQGMGLGKALTVAGITHLQSLGLHAVMLYVDGDNSAAVALYKKLGFTRWDTDVMYAPNPK